MKLLHELSADAPLNVRRISGRIERISETLLREAEPLCTEIEALHVLKRLPELFGDDGAKVLLHIALQLSQLNQLLPAGEPLVSENLLSQAVTADAPMTSVVVQEAAQELQPEVVPEATPAAKAPKSTKKPN